MALHTLTQGEMDALGEYVFSKNNVSGSQTIDSTGHTPAEWVQEFNDALQCKLMSGFGKSYAERPTKPPFPPRNMNGNLSPPEEPPTANLGRIPDRFVGMDIEV